MEERTGLPQEPDRNDARRVDAEAEAARTRGPSEELQAKPLEELVHELRLHQVELQGQNEELLRAQQELEASRARYFELYNLAPVGYVGLSEESLVLEANLAAAELLGVGKDALIGQPLTRFIFPDDQDTYYLQRKQLLGAGPPQVAEFRMLRTGASPFWARLEAAAVAAAVTGPGQGADGAPVIRLVISDITERKSREEEREIVVRLLRLINSDNNLRGLMREATLLLRKWSACDAVGIRLRDGDDFPYFETRGFPAQFVAAERVLCRYDAGGQPERDAGGNPLLECMCGDVLCGRFDPDRPFFTAFGSFWTNSSTEHLASATAEDLPAYARNRCNTAGYESVALIPLHREGTSFGLLQFNDKRRGRFTPERIALLERLADNLAIAITHREMREALLEGERFTRATMDSLSVHVCVLSEAGVVLSVNRAWTDFAAANPPIVGNVGVGADYLAVCDAAAGPDAETARAFAAGIRAVMAGTRPVFELEYPCHSPQVQRWFMGRVTPFADAGARRVVIAHENISERKLGEEMLRKEASFRAAVIERVGEGLCVCHEIPEPPHVAFTVWNARMTEITGYTRDQINRLGWYQMMYPDPDVQARAVERMARMRTGADLVAEEWEITCADGQKRTLAISTSVLGEDDDGTHVLAFMRDRTEGVRAEAELQERRRQLYHMERVQAAGEMASSLAHEVSQPLAGILSNSQAALRYLEGDQPDLDQIREILSDIVSDDRRAGEILSRMRAMVRQEAPGYVPLDINDVVRGAIALGRVELLFNGVMVRVELADGLPRVCGDKTQIDQVLLNLFLNAEQAMQNMAVQEREVVVSTARDGPDCVTISVMDTGPGIAAEAEPRLFDSFYTTKAEGMGMGLSICRSIVSAHGGRIWAENCPGGARVSFTLPTAEGNENGGTRIAKRT